MGRKGGRPRSTLKDPDSNEYINGLSVRKDGSIYATGTNKRFGKDARIAIRRFRAWQQGAALPAPQMVTSGWLRLDRLRKEAEVYKELRDPEDLLGMSAVYSRRMVQAALDSEHEYDSVPDHIKPLFTNVLGGPEREAFSLFRLYMLDKGFDREVREHDESCDTPEVGHAMNDDGTWGERLLTWDEQAPYRAVSLYEKYHDQHWVTFRDWVTGRWIEQNPEEAAKRLGIPKLANLQAIEPPPPSETLESLAKLFEKKPVGETEYKRRVSNWFREFAKVARVRTVRQLKGDHFDDYYHYVVDACKAGKHSTYWMRGRFGAIRLVFNYAIQRNKDTEEVGRVIELCRILKTPSGIGKAKKPPRVIARDELHALLGQADTIQTAVLLVGINAAYDPIDFGRLPLEAVHLDERFIQFNRRKTDADEPVPRVATLWPRTVEAIRTYMKEHPHQAVNEHGERLLFATAGGKQITTPKSWLGKWFRPLREAAGLPAIVKFKQFRKGANTEARQISKDLADVLLGHKIGPVDDAYLVRNPHFVAPACAAIEAHYFGKP